MCFFLSFLQVKKLLTTVAVANGMKSSKEENFKFSIEFCQIVVAITDDQHPYLSIKAHARPRNKRNEDAKRNNSQHVGLL